MTKIKKIEKIKRRWEAAELALRDCGMVGKAGVIMRRIEGINAALEILNQPSNDVNRPGASKDRRCTCSKCTGLPDAESFYKE